MISTRAYYATLLVTVFALGAVLLLWNTRPRERSSWLSVPCTTRPPEPAAPLSAPAHPLGEHPHPITPERVQLQQRLQLVAALNDAFDRHDITGLRRLIKRYRAADPNDDNALGAGYERLADCLQSPGAASRANAQDYYDHERASTLRRYVRRTCLE